jgi:serine phosphatase RsbU (regulator of sigma subunit)/anti-sigma regulatory factor (Ser/Thr protein kinase)
VSGEPTPNLGGLLELPSPPSFERAARLAAYMVRAPVAIVCLVDDDRRVIKACVAPDRRWTELMERSLPRSLCGLVVERGAPVAIDDAAAHPMSREDPGLEELGVGAYLGAPLVLPDGRAVGTLAAIDTQPRAWTPASIAGLRQVAASLAGDLEGLIPGAAPAARPASVVGSRRRRRRVDRPGVLGPLLTGAPVPMAVWDDRLLLVEVNDAFAAISGRSVEEHLGCRASELVPGLGEALEDAIADMLLQGEERRRLEASASEPDARAGATRHWLVDLFRADRHGYPGAAIGAAITEITQYREAEGRLAFLAEVSDLMERRLGAEERLSLLARLVVPGLADFCTVELAEADGGSRLVAVAHEDAAKEPLVVALRTGASGYPVGAVVARVMRTGEPELTADLAPGVAEGLARGGTEAQILRMLRPASAITVPLRSRGRVLGAMRLVRADPERRYGPSDLALAEELARRAAVSVDNAHLYEMGQAARRAAEHAAGSIMRLQRVTAALARALTPEQVGEAVVRQGVDALGAAAGALAVREDDESRVLRAAGYDGGLAADRSLPADAGEPLAVAAREGVAVWPGREGGEGAIVDCAVPLQAAAGTIGAIGFRFGPGAALDEDRRQLIVTLGLQAAQALERAAFYASAHSIADTLQRSLLPGALPQVAGSDLAVRYLAAGEGIEAGGDWYEAIALPQGRIGLGIGDVVGRGVRAAAIMGQLRSALRAFAIDGDPPATVLSRLARYAERLDEAALATAAYAVFDPVSGELRYGCAGHPPPLVVDAEGRTHYLEDGRAAPLAAWPGVVYRDAVAHLEPGAMLLLYTDGLVERRRESLDIGFARLAKAVAGAVGQGPEEVCDHVLTSLMGAAPSGDDVALLVLRRVPWPAEALELMAPARPGELSALRAAVRGWLSAAGADADETSDVTLACGEALANAAEHAYRDAGTGLLELRLGSDGAGGIVLRVRDYGSWRRSAPVPDRGRGLALMRMLMDSVELDRTGDGTEVVMRRKIRGLES